jgi:hypothetical protein
MKKSDYPIINPRLRSHRSKAEAIVSWLMTQVDKPCTGHDLSRFVDWAITNDYLTYATKAFSIKTDSRRYKRTVLHIITLGCYESKDAHCFYIEDGQLKHDRHIKGQCKLYK